MSDEDEFDEESYQAYEDELYGQNSHDSEDSSVESEIEETLYGQVHYSFSLPETSTTEEKDIIEISSQTSESADDVLMIKNEEDIIAISSGDEESNPGIQANWDLDENDLDDGKGSSKRSASRYYKPNKKAMYIRCHNCNERGHMVADCPDPKRISKCNLCGDTGHIRRFCTNELCFNCSEPGHQSRSCRKPRRRHYDQCHRCFLEGHLKTDCPDHWRQYHRTVKAGRIIKPKDAPDPARLIYCYNCAQQGHYGHECSHDRMEPRQSATFPFIVHYDGCPSSDVSQGDHTRRYDKHQGGHGMQHNQYDQAREDRRRSWPEHKHQQYNRQDSTHNNQHGSEYQQYETGKRGTKRGHDNRLDKRRRKKAKGDHNTHNNFHENNSAKKKKNKKKSKPWTDRDLPPDQKTVRIVELVDRSADTAYTQGARHGESWSHKPNNSKSSRLARLSEDMDNISSHPGSNRGFRPKKRLGYKAQDKLFTM